MTDTPIYDTLKHEHDLERAGKHVHKGLHGDFGYVWCSWCGRDWEGPEEPEDDPCSEYPNFLFIRYAAIKRMRDDGKIDNDSFLTWINALKPEYRALFDDKGHLLV